MIWALDALSALGLISCRLCMAFKPKGVAALSNPKRFAEKFIIIWPIAGCPFGNSGKSFEKKGPMILDNNLMPPALSAMLIKPINKAIILINPILMLTALLQVS